MGATDQHTLESSEKFLAIVDELAERGDAGVTELAEATSIHKSTVYVHLQTMLEKDVAVKAGEKYRLSLTFLSIAEKVRNNRPAYRRGRGEIDSLAKETGELVCLGVPESDATVIVHTARGEKASQTIGDGTEIPMLDSPMGKVLLAFGAAREADGGNADAADAWTTGADDAVDPDELRAELDGIREDGYCVSSDRSVGGIPYIAEPERDRPRSESHRTDVRNRAVAAPVLHRGEPVAAVGVTGPSKRISGEYLERIRAQVVQTAAMIGKKLDVGRAVPGERSTDATERA